MVTQSDEQCGHFLGRGESEEFANFEGHDAFRTSVVAKSRGSVRREA